MRRSYREVLSYFGAEDRELDHLLSCSECDIEQDYEDVTFIRCAINPQRIYSDQERTAWAVGWGLAIMAGYRKPPGISMVDINEIMDRWYKPVIEQMMEDLNRPLFGQS